MARTSNSRHQRLQTRNNNDHNKSIAVRLSTLFGDFLDKLEEPASVDVWMYGGYLRCCAMFHCLGSLRRAFLDTVTRQNVDDSNEVYLMARTMFS